MKPSKLTKPELKKFGVTYADTKPAEGGLVRRTCLTLTCDQCGESWGPPIVRSGQSLPDGYWVCPNGCNKPSGKKSRKGAK